MTILVKLTNWYRKKLGTFIVNYIKTVTGNKILEVGCQDGLYSIIFAKEIHDSEVWGVDYWKKNSCKEIPKKNLQKLHTEGIENNVKFRNTDLKKLPFLDNYFEIVCSFNIFHNIHLDRRRRLIEMIRVLHPKGFLIMFGGMISMLNYDILPLTNIQFKNFRLTKILIAEKTKDKLNEDLILKRNPFPSRSFGAMFLISGILSFVFQLIFLIQYTSSINDFFLMTVQSLLIWTAIGFIVMGLVLLRKIY
ncbi:MAG: class I SAM-dependent methyltransferase [Candidatus Helarchaeota archaeon]